MHGPVCRLGPSHSRTPPEPRLGGETLWLQVDGGTLAVEKVGQGPTVVLLHGWTLDRRMWTMQARALANRFTLVAIDRRGFGQSTAPPHQSPEPRKHRPAYRKIFGKLSEKRG